MQLPFSSFFTCKKVKELLKCNSKANCLKWIALSTASAGLLIYMANRMKVEAHPSVPWLTEPHPFLGHIPFYSKYINRLSEELSLRLNSAECSQSPIHCMYVVNNYEHYITSPELVQWVFNTEFKKFKKFADKELAIWEVVFGKPGDGIFVADGEEWRFHRKIGGKMFGIRNVRGFMYDCCVNTTQKIMLKLQELQKDESFAIVDINDLLGRMTFDCFTRIAFGTEFDSMSLYPDIHPFGKAFDTILRTVSIRYYDILSPIKKMLNIGFERCISECDQIINDCCNEILQMRVKKQIANDENKENEEKSFDLMSLYIAQNPQLTDYQLRKIALHFIIAGRDTTRMLLSWFIYDMCCFPKFKKQLYSEIDDEHKNRSEDDECLSYRLVSNFANGLQFLECCLCESLRFHPAVPFGNRIAIEDIEIPAHILFPNGNRKLKKPFIIRKGEKIVMHNPSTSRNTAFFDEPNEYRPERYQTKGVRTFPTNVYTFFNLQPRLCLGRDFALMEAKIFVYHFFGKYDFELVAGQEISSTPGPILNMANGMKIKIVERSVSQAEI